MYKKTIITFLFGAAFFSFSALNVLACDWMRLEKIEDQKKFEAAVGNEYKNSFAVFSGEVIELRQTTVKFKIDKVWKGNVNDEYVMSTGTRLVYGGTESSDCDYPFKFRGEYLVFAFETKFGDVQTYLFTLTQELKDAGRTISVLNKKPKIKKAENSRS